MNRRHDDAIAVARRWQARGDACLNGAAGMPSAGPGAPWPRLQLLSLALECQLKAFLFAARGGAPDTHDIGRLVTLAGHCGLALTREDTESIVEAARWRAGGGQIETTVTVDQQTRAASLCRRLSEALPC